MVVFKTITSTIVAIFTSLFFSKVVSSQTIFSWKSQGYFRRCRSFSFFAGDDLNQDVSISLLQGEIVDFKASFSGRSVTAPFTINAENLIRMPGFKNYI